MPEKRGALVRIVYFILYPLNYILARGTYPRHSGHYSRTLFLTASGLLSPDAGTRQVKRPMLLTVLLYKILLHY